MSQKTWPKARKDDLSITTVGDETVVFDRLSNKASCLNPVTTTVWQACDGKCDTASLLNALWNAGYQDASEETILLALKQLDEAELLDASFNMVGLFPKDISRREMLLSLGKGAALAIPVLSTIEIQPAIAAGSCDAAGESCTPGSCCSGLSCNGGTCTP